MSYVNLIKILFSMMTISTILLGGLVNYLEKHLPIYIQQTFRYGKFSYNGSIKSMLKPIEVPKSWFKHFYIFSSILTTIALTLLVKSYCFEETVPKWIISILDYMVGVNRGTSNVSAVASLLAMILLTIQCFRRLYDTHYISVFGANSQMNLIHYLVGFFHYAGAVLAILSEAPHFYNTSTKIQFLQLTDLLPEDMIASVLFLWACRHQYNATVILADLRKDKKGKVITDKHLMPEGDWFDFVSSPHLLSEVLMYFSLTIILWNNSTWWYIFLWVLSNQTETALLSHWWYKATFPKYPKGRKALVPFVF